MQDYATLEAGSGITTIQRFIAETERSVPGATGAFSEILRNLALAAKIVSREVRRAGLADILGKAEQSNPSGDDVKKLDVFANEMIVRAMEHGGQLCVMASEENESVIPIPDRFPKGKYVMVFDPLDGSSNIDANVTIGTIFSILRRKSESGHGTMEDIVQPGYEQVAAGYIMYGSSTIMVFTSGNGLNGFTLDSTIGSFLLSHRDMKIPSKGKIYSVNEGNKKMWDEGIRRYVEYLQETDPATNRPYSMRYVGSMIADVHRTILYGGIFMYPGDSKNPDGKLRLIYEASPMAFVVEQAGGKATTGKERILDIQPTKLHQRVPVFLGSVEDVEMAEKYISGQA